MKLNEVAEKILERYGEGEENKALRDRAFENAARYYFERCVYVNGESIFGKVWSRSDYSCPAVFRKKKGIDLAAKDADGNFWTARVINCTNSNNPCFQEAVRSFILESKEAGIKPDCQTLVLFKCSVPRKDERKIRKNGIRILTDEIMGGFDLNWAECRWA